MTLRWKFGYEFARSEGRKPIGSGRISTWNQDHSSGSIDHQRSVQPHRDSRVSRLFDTTVFHTYKIAKHGDVSVDILVDRLPRFGSRRTLRSRRSGRDRTGEPRTRTGISSTCQSTSAAGRPGIRLLDVSQNRLQQDDREPRYLTDKSATNLRYRLMIRFDPPEGVALHMHDPVTVGTVSIFNSRRYRL